MRADAKCQLRENVGSKLEFVSNQNFVCSVKLSLLGDNDYNHKLNTFIITLFECNNTLNLNNFGIKYASFAQVAAK